MVIRYGENRVSYYFIRKKAQKTIEFVDYFNPEDVIWQKRFGLPNTSKTFAIGGKKITFFRNDNAFSIRRRIKKAYCHEIGHYIDSRHMVNGSRFSESQEWIKAIANDTIVSGRKAPTSYAQKDVVEDFAESVYAYTLYPTAFEKRFPNRVKIIKRLLGLR